MKNIWNSNDFLKFSNSELDKRVYSSRLLGSNYELVVYGGGNTSVKGITNNIFGEEIVGLNIPKGVPLVYELDEQLSPMKQYYLGDQDVIAKKAAAVVAQGKSK